MIKNVIYTHTIPNN